MGYRTRAEWADAILAPLFADGRQPSKRELFDAYPWGQRHYSPYKVWLQRIKVWKAGGPAVYRKPIEPLDGQPSLFAEVSA